MIQRQIKIGSRESKLAVEQAQIVIRMLKEAVPGIEAEIVTMKTTGDLILDKPLAQIGGKGLFVKELDTALMEGRCDLSVHSLKDMPMEIPGELPILAYSAREDMRDALVLREDLKELPPQPVIGTGSRRRILQAGLLYPDAEFKGIRGNLPTRLKKLEEDGYDALIMAAAGLKRLGLEGRIYRYFSAEEIIPSAGQGIMAIQGRTDECLSFVEKIDSKEARTMALAERSFVRALDGGCTSPVAANAEVIKDVLTLRGLYFEEGTGRFVTGIMSGAPEEAEKLGEKLALTLKRKLENERLQEL